MVWKFKDYFGLVNVIMISFVIWLLHMSHHNIMPVTDLGKSDFVDLDTIKWENRENIFFIAFCDGNELFPGIELCSFESASKYNLETNIVVVLSDTVTMCIPPDYFKEVLNIYFVKVNYTNIFKGTPLEQLWKSGNVQKSPFHLSHISDMLRFALVYKYGGTFFDSDVISLKATPKNTNYIILEADDYLVTTVFKFQKGHKFISDYLTDIVATYKPELLNGPSMVTQIVKKLYCVNNATLSEKSDCKENVTLLHASTAYAIPNQSWQIFYDPSRYEEAKSILNSSFAFHYWRHMDAFQKTEYYIDPQHPLYRLAESNCPLSVKNVLKNDIGKRYGKKA